MDKSKEELLKEITQASFAVNDLTLYLDTPVSYTHLSTMSGTTCS